MILVLSLILCCVLICVWWWLSPRGVAPPMYPGSKLFLGHFHLLLEGNLEDFWNKERKLYEYTLNNGGISQLRIVSHVFYVLTNPDDCLYISNTCLDKTYLYKFGENVYGKGLITAKTSSWKLHRKLLNPAFNQQILYSFINEYNAQGRRIVSDLTTKVGNGAVDILPDLIHNTLKTVYRTSMGVETSAASDTITSYAEATHKLFILYFVRLQKFWLHFSLIFHFSSLRKQEKELKNILRGITNQVIIKRRLQLKSANNFGNTSDDEPDKFKPLLDRMLDLSDQQNAFTDDEIVDHLGTMVVAAYDTTAISINTVLLLVGSHPRVQERIFEELKTVIREGERDINKGDLAELAYLEAVVKETLRLYPPAPRIGRTSKSDVKLRNYTLRANSTIIISLYGINRHPMWGADADLFRPERWLDPATLPKNINAFASFSFGRRNCIGKSYAIMVIMVCLVHILRSYHVTADITKLRFRADFIQKPVAGHQVAFELRK